MNINLFLLLPETTPCNQWMHSNEPFHPENELNRFSIELNDKIAEINIENYNGFYDIINVNNFFEHYEILDDYYPMSAKRLFRSSVFTFTNWRKGIHSTNTEYHILNQRIEDHTFCELAQLIQDKPEEHHILLNHYAHNLATPITVKFNGKSSVINVISSQFQLIDWFANNRIPQRNFQVTDKHGENRTFIKRIGNKDIYPLRTSKQAAQILLNSAYGDSTKEIFNWDNDKGRYIVFKYEGSTPQNMYHGYHVEADTNEISPQLKARIEKRRNG